MYILFKNGYQRDLVNEARRIAGSERKLSKLLGIPKRTVYDYKNEIYNIPLKRLTKILKLLGLSFEDLNESIIDVRNQNWGRQKGGFERINRLKQDGMYGVYLENLKKRSSKVFRDWHKNMKSLNPEVYYKMQHDRFKKIGCDKFVSISGHKVRNSLEKKVADILYNNSIDYAYEMYLSIEGKTYFPDFVVGGTIIECTMWRHESKAKALKKRIEVFNRNGFKTLVVITKDVEKFYKGIKDYIVTEDKDIIAGVA